MFVIRDKVRTDCPVIPDLGILKDGFSDKMAIYGFFLTKHFEVFLFLVDMLKGVKVEVGPHNSKRDESSRMSHHEWVINRVWFLILLDFLLLQHSLDFWFDHIELKWFLRVVSAIHYAHAIGLTCCWTCGTIVAHSTIKPNHKIVKIDIFLPK